MFRITIITILFTAAGAASGADKNLLLNGDFSTAAQLNAWNCVAPNTAEAFGSYQWSNEDAGGSGTSGSMSLSATAVETYSDVYCTSTCMPVRPSAAYTLGGQNRGYPASFGCYAYSDSACSVYATLIAGPTMSGTADWSTPEETSGMLPNNAYSVSCTASVAAAFGSAIALFDNLFFTTDVIFANGLEAL
jgi:hypothetical protein